MIFKSSLVNSVRNSSEFVERRRPSTTPEGKGKNKIKVAASVDLEFIDWEERESKGSFEKC